MLQKFNFFVFITIIIVIILNIVHTESFSDKQIFDIIELSSGDYEVISDGSGFETSIQTKTIVINLTLIRYNNN